MKRLYYTVKIRYNGELSDLQIERLRNAIWVHLGNIARTDIVINRTNSPRGEVFKE